MINCRTARTLLSLYIDRELSGRKRTALDVHLATCPDCREELTALRCIAPALDALEVPPMPPFLDTRIMARAVETPTISRVLARWMPVAGLPGWMTAASLICGLVIGGVMGMESLPDQCPAIARQISGRPYCTDEFLCRDHTWSPMDLGSIEAATLALLEEEK